MDFKGGKRTVILEQNSFDWINFSLFFPLFSKKEESEEKDNLFELNLQAFDFNYD